MTDLTRLLIALLLVVGGAVREMPVQGVASWYDAPSPRDAAAGPALRQALGSGWRGSWVRVRSGSHSVVVVLSDFCQCGPRHGKPTILDLDDRAFARLGSLSRGILPVTVTRVERGVPVVVAPETDLAR